MDIYATIQTIVTIVVVMAILSLVGLVIWRKAVAGHRPATGGRTFIGPILPTGWSVWIKRSLVVLALVTILALAGVYVLPLFAKVGTGSMSINFGSWWPVWLPLSLIGFWFVLRDTKRFLRSPKRAVRWSAVTALAIVMTGLVILFVAAPQPLTALMSEITKINLTEESLFKPENLVRLCTIFVMVVFVYAVGKDAFTGGGLGVTIVKWIFGTIALIVALGFFATIAFKPIAEDGDGEIARKFTRDWVMSFFEPGVDESASISSPSIRDEEVVVIAPVETPEVVHEEVIMVPAVGTTKSFHRNSMADKLCYAHVNFYDGDLPPRELRSYKHPGGGWLSREDAAIVQGVSYPSFNAIRFIGDGTERELRLQWVNGIRTCP